MKMKMLIALAGLCCGLTQAATAQALCATPVTCLSTQTTTTTTDASGCKVVKCHNPARTDCPAVQACTGNTVAKTGTNASGCPVVECVEVEGRCGKPTICPSGFKAQTTMGADNCTETVCYVCPQPKPCGLEYISNMKTDESGCITIKCEVPTAQTPIEQLKPFCEKRFPHGVDGDIQNQQNDENHSLQGFANGDMAQRNRELCRPLLAPKPEDEKRPLGSLRDNN